MKLSRLVFSVFSLCLCWGTAALAQRSPGTLRGKVVTEDGQPLPYVTVTLVSAGAAADLTKALNGNVVLQTNANGEFEAERLDPAPYRIQVTAPGYQPAQAFNPTAPDYHFIGETVTLSMQKGGVITGKVTNAAGQPIVGVSVNVVSLTAGVQAPPGLPINVGLVPLSSQQTDDRGVYRVYGLAPGKYVVAAGAGGAGLGQSPFLGRVTTYHPATTTRATATPINLQSGEEISGVDIQYRAEPGHSISGKLLGLASGNPLTGLFKDMTLIVLKRASTDEIVAQTVAVSSVGGGGYALTGIADGEYEVFAAQQGSAENQNAAPPRRVTLKGADLNGIDLTLTPLASITGKLSLEKLPAETAPKCNLTRAAQLDEVVLSARKDEALNKAALDLAALGVNPPAVPTAQGEFTLRGLVAGRYRLAAQLPDESWYVKAVKLPAVAEAARDGLALKAGERLTGVNLTLAVGAASLQGAVKAAAGAKLPARVRVHLVPAEPPARDDVLRYAETVANAQGHFSFSQLAPGKYWLVAQAIPADEQPEKPPRPLAWEAAERAKLRQTASTVNQLIELELCQRQSAVVVPWK